MRVLNLITLKLLPYSTEFSAEDLATGKYDVIPGYLGTITLSSTKIQVIIKDNKTH